MSDDFEKIKADQDTAADSASERIQRDLEKEKDARKEERFIFMWVLLRPIARLRTR